MSEPTDSGDLDWQQHISANLVHSLDAAALNTAKLAPNPKQLFGDKKPRLSLLPLAGQLAQEEAQRDGMLKYGEQNWRDQPVECMTYVDAAKRHLELYLNGEAKARDTQVQNLGAVMACCAILLDAEMHGTMIDNRRHSPAACDALHEAEKMVQHLRTMQIIRDSQKEAIP